MKWLAAMIVATQIASAATGAQSAPALTPQQRQELSTYDFKGAEAALEAQTNESVSKPSPLTPIPPLKVPPITSRSLPAQSSPAGAPADKGSEVPLNWRPPHAELNAAAVSAAEVSRQWETGVATPTPGADGRVVYVFGQGMPVMVCAPLRVCAIELQAGEHLESQPQIGDSRRWEITPVLSGSGLDETPLLIVKPIEAGLETDLIVSTDRRTYVFRLISDPARFVSRLAFQYPDEDAAKWAAFEIRQAAAKRDAEALAEQAHEKENRAGVVPMAENAFDNLYFDYKLNGDAAYRPQQVFDDGQHTYLIYPNDGRFLRDSLPLERVDQIEGRLASNSDEFDPTDKTALAKAMIRRAGPQIAAHLKDLGPMETRNVLQTAFAEIVSKFCSGGEISVSVKCSANTVSPAKADVLAMPIDRDAA